MASISIHRIQDEKPTSIEAEYGVTVPEAKMRNIYCNLKGADHSFRLLFEVPRSTCY